MSNTKSVTISELFDAIEKNGVPHIRGHMWEADTILDPKTGHYTNLIRGGCALAQGLLNLGVSESLYSQIASTIGEEVWNYFRGVPLSVGKVTVVDSLSSYDLSHLHSIGERIVYLNDSRGMTLRDIAIQLRADYKDFLDRVITDVPIYNWQIDPRYATTPEQAEAIPV